MNQVDRMFLDLRNSISRREPSAPNSPRDSGVGVVSPRAMKPEWVSKSKVRQTMWRGTATLRIETRRLAIARLQSVFPALVHALECRPTSGDRDGCSHGKCRRNGTALSRHG